MLLEDWILVSFYLKFMYNCWILDMRLQEEKCMVFISVVFSWGVLLNLSTEASVTTPVWCIHVRNIEAPRYFIEVKKKGLSESYLFIVCIMLACIFFVSLIYSHFDLYETSIDMKHANKSCLCSTFVEITLLCFLKSQILVHSCVEHFSIF